MNRSRIRALQRKLGYDASPEAEYGRAVLRERAAMADQLRAKCRTAMWDVLTKMLPPGQGPPRRLRHADGDEFSAWYAAHVPAETKQQINEALRRAARRIRAGMEEQKRLAAGGPVEPGEHADHRDPYVSSPLSDTLTLVP